MKKTLSFIVVAVVFTVFLSSCGSSKQALSVVPQATNTVATIGFDDLNLQRKDYKVLNTITAEATLYAHFTNDEIKVTDPDGGFSLKWLRNEQGQWEAKEIDGILRMGYLSNDYSDELFNVPPYPHWIVRGMATYRIINAAKIAGGDGVIEPVISTNVEQGKTRRDIIYKTTVSAKLIKIEPDNK